jgi:hypothetical protein
LPYCDATFFCDAIYCPSDFLTRSCYELILW